MNLKSLQFYGVKFEMYKETIYVEGADQVVFDNCNLKVNDVLVIDITATKVFIKNSILRLNSKGEKLSNFCGLPVHHTMRTKFKKTIKPWFTSYQLVNQLISSKFY